MRSVAGRVGNTDFSLPPPPLNFGGVLCAPRVSEACNPPVFSASPLSLHREYTGSFITVGLVAEIPELSGYSTPKCQILISENNHVGVKGRDIQARRGRKQNSSKRIFIFGATEKRLKRQQCKLNCAACKMGGLLFILGWYSLF